MKKNFHHKISTFSLAENPFWVWFDLFLIIFSAVAITADFIHIYPSEIDKIILISLSFIGFIPVALSAVKALINRKLTIDLLASIALVFSFFSSEWRSVVFISLMLASARLFAYFTESQTKNAIKKLLKLRPEKIHMEVDGKIVEKKLRNIKISDLVVVDAGERIAVDGIIISGSASIDQSFLTGESEPVFKKEGDEILGSTLNVSGFLVVKVTKIGENTTFSKILKLIDESQQNKAPISILTDKFVTYYILFTLIGAIAIYFYFGNLIMVLSILLVTCADDLAVAIPLAFISTITVAAKKGIIIKGASYIEGFTKVKAFIFDKTGTITKGKPEIQNIVAFDNFPEKELFSILGSATVNSTHPTSKAIYSFVKEKNIKFPIMQESKEEPGYGIGGLINGKQIFVGKPDFLKKDGINFSREQIDIFDKERNLGRSLVVVGYDKKVVGFVSSADAIHHQAKEVIDTLKAIGIEKITMLTGDNERVASQVASQVHITDFKANLLPGDKVNLLKKVLSDKYKTVMVGDGINDAASIALADIGIAMGAIGSDATIETADIVLMKDKLSNLIELTKLSTLTMKKVKQNIFLWAAINIIGLGLVFGGVLNPSGAAAFNFVTDFIPLLNSLSIFLIKL
ncbi:MAG: cation-translocating P-type ATPase [Candidatus Staskawiczbacteria bacterium]|nr:cation-translocating P-type ATPase [Candidatus Staskawiczbacteria bacterium]